MSKNRKKHCQPGMQKVLQAQHRNDYFKRLGIFLKALTGEDVLALIPQEKRELIFRVRLSPIVADPEEGHSINPKLMEAIKVCVNNWFKSVKRTSEKTNEQIPLSEYFNFGFPLYIYLSHIQNDRNTEKIKDLLFDHFGHLETTLDFFFDEIYDSVFLYFIMLFNRVNRYYFSFKLTAEQTDNKCRIRYLIKVKKYPAEKVHVTIDGNTRTAYRVGWTLEGDTFEWVNITPAQLGINSTFSTIQIPVYIQMHALRRLLERADSVPFHFLNYCIFRSLKNCIAIPDNDKFLIEYRVGVKIGYFSAILKDGILIIRTFLFLTCKGTPEAKRLEELVGLQKLDTKYLKMDRLSTFMSAKISTNEEVRSIFKKADCLHLLELFDNLNTFSEEQPEDSNLEMITSYLKTNDVQLDEFVTEDLEEENHKPHPSR